MTDRKRMMQIGAVVGLGIFFTSLVMFFLVGYNNKYTHDGLQPVVGTLILDQERLEEEPYDYLTREWQYFPDVLLTPDDFAEGNFPAIPMETVTIGKYNTFSHGDPTRPPAGSASYRLTLVLPESPQIYTIVLPEIYSAYRFYVGANQLVCLGTPEAEGFQERIGERTVSFLGSGKTELLLAVSSGSHFYSGLNFPPLFGLQEDVNRMQTIRLVVSVAKVAITVLVSLLSLYLFLTVQTRRDKRALLFLLTALCLTVTYLYPLLFSLITLPPKPFYALELFSMYGVYFLVILLQNDICKVGVGARRWSACLSGGFCVLALVYGLLPAYSAQCVTVFGFLATLMKFLTAGYLLLTAATAVFWSKQGGVLLLFCTTSFGVTIFFDRFFSAFEPIFGGWLSEYGGAVLVVGLGVVLWNELTNSYRFQLAFTEEKRQLTRQVAMQKRHYEELGQRVEEAVRARHDLRHHMQMLMTFLESADFQKMGAYLLAQNATLMPRGRTVLCDNLIADAALQYYKALCTEQKVAFTCRCTLPRENPMVDTDFSSMLCNLLENAYEAASLVAQGGGTAFVRVQMKAEDGQFILKLDNSYQNPLRYKGERLLSSKHEGFGIGTQSVSSVVEGLGGDLVLHGDEKQFSALVNIPLAW